MKKSFLFAAGMFLTAASILGCKSKNEVDLKFNVQPGTKFQYSTVTSQQIKQSQGGQSANIDQQITMTSNFEVGAAEGENKKITVSYDRIAMKTTGENVSITYDSKDTAHSDLPLKYLGYMINKPFHVILNPKGDVVRVTGLQEVVDEIVLKNTDPVTTPALKQQIEQQFSDSVVRSILQQSFSIYPDKPVC